MIMTQGVFSRNACPFKGRNFDVLCIYLLYMKQKSHPNAVQSKGYYLIILVAITIAAISPLQPSPLQPYHHCSHHHCSHHHCSHHHVNRFLSPQYMFETHRGSRSLLPIIVHNVLQLHHLMKSFAHSLMKI